jgi:hypothetical protein
MRGIIFYIYLGFLLMVGGQQLHADTHPGSICDSLSWNFLKKQQVKLTTADHGSVLIEEADVDLDEEFHSSDNLKNGSGNKFLAEKNSLLDDWYLTFSNQSVLKFYSKGFKICTHSCGQSNPIYITQKVLRI